MSLWLRRLWPAFKIVLAVAILVSVGLQFNRDLRRLDLGELTLRPAWLVLSAVLYLLGLGCSAWFWYRLLYSFGERPAPLTTLRAYYIGHLGKYVPGKAWALLMRGTLVRGPEVRLGVAVITAFYEVLTTMAAGACLAAVLFALDPPAVVGLQWDPALLGVLLLVFLGVPLLPGVFNRLVSSLASRFRHVESLRLPRLGIATLAQGLAATCLGWALLGTSLWALLQAILPELQPLTMQLLGRYIAMNGLAYVAGFLALFMPSGVGVREYVLKLFLEPELANQALRSPEAVAALAALAVLLLRLVWTAAELLTATVVYWLPGPPVFARESPADSITIE